MKVQGDGGAAKAEAPRGFFQAKGSDQWFFGNEQGNVAKAKEPPTGSEKKVVENAGQAAKAAELLKPDSSGNPLHKGDPGQKDTPKPGTGKSDEKLPTRSEADTVTNRVAVVSEWAQGAVTKAIEAGVAVHTGEVEGQGADALAASSAEYKAKAESILKDQEKALAPLIDRVDGRWKTKSGKFVAQAKQAVADARAAVKLIGSYSTVIEESKAASTDKELVSKYIEKAFHEDKLLALADARRYVEALFANSTFADDKIGNEEAAA